MSSPARPSFQKVHSDIEMMMFTAVRRWLGRHRIARILIILAIPTTVVGFLLMQNIYSRLPNFESQPISEFSGYIQVIENYQPHKPMVVLDKELEYIPEELLLLGNDTNTVRRKFRLTRNPNAARTCIDFQGNIEEYKVYETKIGHSKGATHRLSVLTLIKDSRSLLS